LLIDDDPQGSLTLWNELRAVSRRTNSLHCSVSANRSMPMLSPVASGCRLNRLLDCSHGFGAQHER